MSSTGKRWEGLKGFSLICSEKKRQKAGTEMSSLSQLTEGCVPDPVPSCPVPRDMAQLGHPVFALLTASCTQLPLLLPSYLPAGNLG